MRKISIIHATRRPVEASETVYYWIQRASFGADIEYILSVDSDDYYNYEQDKLLGNTIIIRNPNRSAVDAFNRGAEMATGDIFVCISDDMKCFDNWDEALFKEIGERTDFYMKVQDGLQPTLVTMPIFDRAYYNRLGYVWNPAYKHMFVDQEATAVAIMMGKYFKSYLIFPHAHYSAGLSPKDAVNFKNDSTWGQGQTLFNERLKINFGIANPLMPYSVIKWK